MKRMRLNLSGLGIQSSDTAAAKGCIGIKTLQLIPLAIVLYCGKRFDLFNSKDPRCNPFLHCVSPSIETCIESVNKYQIRRALKNTRYGFRSVGCESAKIGWWIVMLSSTFFI